MSKLGFDYTRKRWFIKIVAGDERCLAEAIYYRSNLTFEMFVKWRWYFEYRQALYIVAFPRDYCELTHGSYDYIPRRDHELKRMRDLIRNKKSTITLWQSKVKKAEDAWCELFPIQNEPHHKKAMAKIEKAMNELLEYEAYYYKLERDEECQKPERIQDDVEITSIDKRFISKRK